MSRINKFGLVVSVIGVLIMLLPFVSGFTGFFSATFKFDIDKPTVESSTIIAMSVGFAIAFIGLFFTKRDEKIWA